MQQQVARTANESARMHAENSELQRGSKVQASESAHSSSSGLLADAAVPASRIVEQWLLPQLAYFFARLVADRTALVLDGTPAFNGRDKFLPGKIAMGLSYLLTNTADDAAPDAYLAGYREIARMTVAQDNDSWGIYYYLSALNKLRDAGLLERALDADILIKLKGSLDWRHFVRQPEFTLIDLPTNYYGVAFSIARLRYQLGWEDASASQILLERMVNHYTTYSGEFGFSDETDGQGRFDRYSILLIGEICQRFIDAGMPVTPQLKAWLRRAVDVILIRLNPAGDGFDFGRSIGAYGDTAFLEVLAAAGTLDVLTAEEKEMAYAFHARVVSKFVSFWYDEQMRSINLWDKGRRTDAYRGKHRILGENLSLTHQLIYTTEQWNRMGYRDRMPSADFDDWLAGLPRFAVTWFAKGDYDRALVTLRDRGRVISLPLVNGGSAQHGNTPYFPIPFSHGLIQGVADASFAQLLPRFILDDGTQLTATCFFRNIEAYARGDDMTVCYHQTELDRLGAYDPIKDHRISVHTTYAFRHGCITRTDVYTPTVPLPNVTIRMEFASFSEAATVTGTCVRFAKGEAYAFEATGFERCDARPLSDDEYCSPTGPMKTLVLCEREMDVFDQALTLSWTLKYR